MCFAILDYAVVLIMAVFIFASLSWIFSARKWFVGPISNLDDRTPPAWNEKMGQTKDE